MKKKNVLPIPLEYDDQCSIFTFAQVMAATNQNPDLKMLWASLNGVRLTIGQAVKAKKAGMKKGYPDIGLDVARGGYHGLRIELKREKGGRLEPEQKEWLQDLAEYGYFACVCRGANAAKLVLINYLRGEYETRSE